MGKMRKKYRPVIKPAGISNDKNQSTQTVPSSLMVMDISSFT